MRISDYKLADPEIPKISKTQFLKLTPEKQKEYLRLYKTQIIPKLSVLREHHRFYTIHGGRGSGKSTSVAKWLTQKMTAETHTLLCTREIQNSLAESSYQMLVDMIAYQELGGWNIQKEKIFNDNGSKIIFHGLRDNKSANSLKSYVNIDLVWCEEAQSLSANSLRLLLPTIREEGAEFYFTYNPETEEDAVEIIKTRQDVLDVEVNWNDNPFFPEQLRMEMEADFKTDPDEAEHVWNGQYRKQAENAVMSRLAVHEAMEREVDTEGDYQIAVDVARYGSDSSIISMRKGLKMIDLKEYKNISLVELCGHIEVIAGNNHDMTIKVDETGVGGGVVDILQGRGYRNVIGINFGSKPQDTDKFADLPSEMWCTFPISDVSLLNDSGLFHELTDRRFSYDHKARRQVESKDSYKARNGGKSPDKADSVLMLYYEPKINRPMLY